MGLGLVDGKLPPLPTEERFDGGSIQEVLSRLNSQNGYHAVELRLTRDAALRLLASCPEITITDVCIVTYPEG